jgi:predicted metal-binding membrane protein
MTRAERTTASTLRSTGVVRSQSAVAGLIRRDRVVITSCIVLITALAWAYLVHLHNQMSSSEVPETMMAKMGMVINAPWGAPDVFFTFLMWAVMMIGMMSATATPVLLLFSGMHGQQGERGAPFTVLLFGLGYITVWLGFSASAALAQWGLHQGALLSSSMAAASPRLAGAILIAAGAYQLTPAKGACLRQCQSPLGFLLSNWRDGASGALQMGLRHGVYCLGCCWALMCVLFAVGVMNLAWVAALTAFILVEKFGRTGALVSRVGGVVMIAFGVLVVAR